MGWLQFVFHFPDHYPLFVNSDLVVGDLARVELASFPIRRSLWLATREIVFLFLLPPLARAPFSFRRSTMSLVRDCSAIETAPLLPSQLGFASSIPEDTRVSYNGLALGLSDSGSNPWCVGVSVSPRVSFRHPVVGDLFYAALVVILLCLYVRPARTSSTIQRLFPITVGVFSGNPLLEPSPISDRTYPSSHPLVMLSSKPFGCPVTHRSQFHLASHQPKFPHPHHVFSESTWCLRLLPSTQKNPPSSLDLLPFFSRTILHTQTINIVPRVLGDGPIVGFVAIGQILDNDVIGPNGQKTQLYFFNPHRDTTIFFKGLKMIYFYPIELISSLNESQTSKLSSYMEHIIFLFSPF